MNRLIDNRAAGRFERQEPGGVTFADYRREDGRLIIDHVETPPALRGAGAAGRLMESIVRQAAAEGRGIVPLCGYAAAWLRRHADGPGAGEGTPPRVRH